MSKNKECTVCGKKYEYCDHCNKYSTGSSWRKSYCSEECRQIFRTCVKYVGGGISQEEAFKQLKSYNVTSKTIQPSVKETVDNIMDYKVENVDSQVEFIDDLEDTVDATVVTETVENDTVDTADVIVVEEKDDDEEVKVTEEPKHRPRRRRMKKTEE